MRKDAKENWRKMVVDGFDKDIAHECIKLSKAKESSLLNNSVFIPIEN